MNAAKKEYTIGERLAGDHRNEVTGEWKRVRGKFQGRTLAGSVTIDGMLCAPNSVRRVKLVKKPSWLARVHDVRHEFKFPMSPYQSAERFAHIKITVDGAITNLNVGDKVKLVRA
jgi:hypothetical protein